MSDPIPKRFYCYTEASDKFLAQSGSNLSPTLKQWGNRTIGYAPLLKSGFNIIERLDIERLDLPRGASYICSVIVVEYENNCFKVLKDRWSDHKEYEELLTKINNKHKFSSEEITLYLTDPNPFIRTMFQYYISNH